MEKKEIRVYALQTNPNRTTYTQTGNIGTYTNFIVGYADIKKLLPSPEHSSILFVYFTTWKQFIARCRNLHWFYMHVKSG